MKNFPKKNYGYWVMNINIIWRLEKLNVFRKNVHGPNFFLIFEKILKFIKKK